MEFSFDRSRVSNPHSNTNQTTDSSDSTNVTNERLRKAIERNRARQKEREGIQTRPVNNEQPVSSAWAQHQAAARVSNPREEFVEEKPQATMESSRPEPIRRMPETPPRKEYQAAEEKIINERPVEDTRAEYQEQSLFENQNTNQKVNEPEREEIPRVQIRREMSTATPTRRTVAKPDETEFTPIKRTTRKAASHISYTTGVKKKGKELDPKYTDYLVKGSWIFCGFLILRLVFANGGVVDYFSQKKTLNERIADLSRIKKENMSLVHEIERMQLDAAYQKRLVRDNLGFIAQDEFLILFPKD